MASPVQTVPPEDRIRHLHFLEDSYVIEWGNLSLRTDIIFMLAIAICLFVGIAVEHPGAGLISAGGAMTVGFGAKQDIDESRLRPMIFVSIGIAFSTFVGMVAGHENFVLVPLAALSGFGYGMLSNRPSGYGWVGQQCVVFLLVSSAFPFSAKAAAVRALLVLAGGAVQILCTSLLLHLLTQLRADLLALAQYVRTEELLLRTTIADAARSLRQGQTLHAALPYATRLAVTLGVSTYIYAKLHFASGYWIPMTALLVLKPGISDTVSRAIARTLGTITGALLASFAAAHLTPSTYVLAGCTVFFAWLAYATLNVNYALFSTCLTAYIVFILSLAGLPSHAIAVRRTICTAIGGGLALAVRLVVISYRKRTRLADNPVSPTH
jgi:Fusaric acid resistance protein-like